MIFLGKFDNGVPVLSSNESGVRIQKRAEKMNVYHLGAIRDYLQIRVNTIMRWEAVKKLSGQQLARFLKLKHPERNKPQERANAIKEEIRQQVVDTKFKDSKVRVIRVWMHGQHVAQQVYLPDYFCGIAPSQHALIDREQDALQAIRLEKRKPIRRGSLGMLSIETKPKRNRGRHVKKEEEMMDVCSTKADSSTKEGLNLR